jgi:hypothetical protein
MIKPLKDLGLLLYGKQRCRFWLVACEMCGVEKKRKASDIKNKEKYLCGSCSQKTHGLSKDKEHLRELARIWRSHNLERVKMIHNRASAKYKAKNSIRVNDYYYKRKYGITKYEAEELKKNGCFVCKSQSRLCIDHDHITGQIRGILCDKHNRALGMLGDTKEDIVIVLEKYKEYFLPKQIIMETIKDKEK